MHPDLPTPRCLVLVGALLLSATVAAARATELELAPVMADHMVLQRGQANPLWGLATPGASVTVRFRGQTYSTEVDASGKWHLRAAAGEAGGPFTLAVRSDDEKRILEDVYVGEVWLASGQSNMDWPLRKVKNAKQVIASADHPKVRFFTARGPAGTRRRAAATPKNRIAGRWRVCTPRQARRFSGVAYFFARQLHATTGLPVGVLQAARGGSRIESWVSMPVIEEVEAAAPILQRYASAREGFQQRLERYRQQRAEWEKKRDAARQKGEPIPRPVPRYPFGPGHKNQPAGLFNGMIHPLVPYGIRGVIWYQGESCATARQGDVHHALLPALIRDWRRRWDQGQFPFYMVQLANYTRHPDAPGWSWFAEVRHAQLQAFRELSNTGLAVAIDLGGRSIHPKNKQDVGKRLARIALARVHDRDLVWSGPIFTRMETEGGRVRLYFDHVSGGLTTSDGEPPRRFAIAGKDRNFVWADAKIDGKTVVVQSDRVPNPVAVRYGWANNPVATLRNEAGLPASPFRTDDWPAPSRE